MQVVYNYDIKMQNMYTEMKDFWASHPNKLAVLASPPLA